MSYDLEIRSDDEYSRAVQRDQVIQILEEFGSRRQMDDYLVFEDSARKQHIEIDLGASDAEAKPVAGDMVNFVGLGVPYPYLEASGPKALEIAFGVAARLGWRVFDPQADSYLQESDAAVAKHAQATALSAFDQLSENLDKQHRSFFARVLDRFMRQTVFSISVAVLAGITIAAYAATTTGQERRSNPRPFVGAVLAGTVALLLLRPVVAEWLDTRTRDPDPH